jgi:hypothetical protein
MGAGKEVPRNQPPRGNMQKGSVDVRRGMMNKKRTEFLCAALLILCLMVPVLIACAGEKQEQNYTPVASAEEKQEQNHTPVASAEEKQEHNYKPEEGYVPDAETAIKIAVAVWLPIYGKEQIESEKPYSASLEDGIWYVTGSLPEGPGGVAEAEIAKENGCVLRISHGE